MTAAWPERQVVSSHLWGVNRSTPTIGWLKPSEWAQSLYAYKFENMIFLEAKLFDWSMLCHTRHGLMDGSSCLSMFLISLYLSSNCCCTWPSPSGSNTFLGTWSLVRVSLNMGCCDVPPRTFHILPSRCFMVFQTSTTSYFPESVQGKKTTGSPGDPDVKTNFMSCFCTLNQPTLP